MPGGRFYSIGGRFSDYNDSKKTVFAGKLPPPREIFCRSKNMLAQNPQANVRSTSPNIFDSIRGLLKYSDLNM